MHFFLLVKQFASGSSTFSSIIRNRWLKTTSYFLLRSYLWVACLISSVIKIFALETCPKILSKILCFCGSVKTWNISLHVWCFYMKYEFQLSQMTVTKHCMITQHFNYMGLCLFMQAGIKKYVPLNVFWCPHCTFPSSLRQRWPTHLKHQLWEVVLYNYGPNIDSYLLYN